MEKNAIYECVIGIARSLTVDNKTVTYKQLIEIIHAIFGPDYYKRDKGQGIAKVVREACKYAAYFYGKETDEAVKKTFHR